MKKYLLGVLYVFILVGCGKYTQPIIDKANIAYITLEEYMPFDNGYGLETNTYIDGKYISKIDNIRVSIGKRILSFEITAFYNRLAKYVEVKNLNLNVKPNNKYTIKIMSDKKFYEDVLGNVGLKILVYENKNLIIKKNIIAQNSRAKTVEKYPDLESQIGTILGAIL